MGEHYAEDVGVGSSILSFLIYLFILECSLSVMKIIRLEDIDKRKQDEKRDRITEDINKVVEGVLGGKKKKEDGNLLWTIGKVSLGILVLMLIANLILGNIWLLKFFWGEFF